MIEEDELEVVIRYKVGASTVKLAERFGVSERTIGRVLDKHKVPKRPRQEPSSVTPGDVAELRASGLAFEDIAEILDVSYGTVRNRWAQYLAEEVHRVA